MGDTVAERVKQELQAAAHGAVLVHLWPYPHCSRWAPQEGASEAVVWLLLGP